MSALGTNTVLCSTALWAFLLCPPCLAKRRPELRVAVVAYSEAFQDIYVRKAVAMPLLAYVANKFGVTYSLAIPDTLETVEKGLASGHFNAARTTALQYVRLTESPKTKLYAISKNVYGGKDSSRLLLLVHAKSGIRKLSDLKGKTLCYDSQHQLNKVYLRVLLSKNGVDDPGTFFSSISVKKKLKQCLLNTYLEETDACLVSDFALSIMSKLNPRLSKDLRTIHASKSFATPPFFASADLPRKTRERIRKVFLEAHTTKKGKQILVLLKIDRIVAANDADYDSVRRLWQEYQKIERKKTEKADKTKRAR